jgi:hypothetical protein
VLGGSKLRGLKCIRRAGAQEGYLSAWLQDRHSGRLQGMSASPLTAVTYAIWVYVAMGQDRTSPVGLSYRLLLVLSYLDKYDNPRLNGCVPPGLHLHRHHASMDNTDRELFMSAGQRRFI